MPHQTRTAGLAGGDEAMEIDIKFAFFSPTDNIAAERAVDTAKLVASGMRADSVSFQQ